MNVKLVVVQGKPDGKEILLRTPKFLIGRGTECHLRPNSELVSRHHCLFLIGETEVRLRDLGSTNGTLLNGLRIVDEVVVGCGDMIQVGPLGFRVLMDPLPIARRSAPVLDLADGNATDRPPDTEIVPLLADDTQYELPTDAGRAPPPPSSLPEITPDTLVVQDTKPDVTRPHRARTMETSIRVPDAAGGVRIKLKEHSGAKHGGSE